MWHEGRRENGGRDKITEGGVASNSDAIFLEGPAGYGHLKRNDKIYSI